jgi:autotransporter-associated beta strand protein
LSVGALNTDSTFSGVISSVGSLALEKTGGGTLTLSGTNSYTGPTAIHNGTLKFIANKNGSGTVTVNSGGTLAGTATVAGPVTVNAGGAITPGNNGAGTLTLSGTTTLTGGGVLKLDLGTTSDLLSLTGTYAGPAAGTVTVNVNALAGFTTGTYPLITGAAGISAASFSIGDFPAGFTGSFTASSGTLSLVVVDLPAPASLVAVGGVNQITLDWPPVPGALHYEVRRSLDSGSGFNPIAAPAGDAFADTTVSNGVTYFYQVAAVNGSTGPPSSVASAVAVPPLTPEELAGPPVTLDGNGVRLGGRQDLSAPAQHDDAGGFLGGCRSGRTRKWRAARA